jgi:hypothetical protein
MSSMIQFGHAKEMYSRRRTNPNINLARIRHPAGWEDDRQG